MPYPLMPMSQAAGSAVRQTLANGDPRPIGAQALIAGKPQVNVFRTVCEGAFIGLIVLLAACTREPPEHALRATITSMQAAAEAKDSDAIMAVVADDFAGPSGMDRTAFRRYVAVSIMRHGKIGIVLGPLGLTIQGERATVSFTAATSGGQGWLPDSGRVHNVRTGWRIDGGDWMLVSAEWD